YDDAGNVKTGFGAVYMYDGTGMVRRAAVGTDIRDFVYTADDERIAVRQGASWTWTVRDQGGKVLREFTSLETSSSPLTLTSHYWSKDYVWRSGLLLASVFPVTPGSMSPTTTYHYHLDHLGTPRLVTDGNHILVGKHTYYPFGAEMNLTPPESAIELMKFTGHERDIVAATNGSVDYMHARYYNANLGRFLSVDPAWDSADLGTPQSWNRYAYVKNTPIGRIDPDGRIDYWVTQLLNHLQSLIPTKEHPLIVDPINRPLATAGTTIIVASIAFGDEPLADATATIERRLSTEELVDAGGSALEQLTAKAEQAHSVLDPIAQTNRTTAALRTSAGDIVGSGARDLTPAQRALVSQNGDAAAKLPGAHAEVTVLNQAARTGAAPQALASTRPFCSECVKAIQSAGGTILDALTAIWP
ncbi:MAG: hypothetical protein JO093_09345, partial [Acidobacteria bacterium]|nr:hypothetical protein [Acidobacteriota bacterium]